VHAAQQRHVHGFQHLQHALHHTRVLDQRCITVLFGRVSARILATARGADQRRQRDLTRWFEDALRFHFSQLVPARIMMDVTAPLGFRSRAAVGRARAAGPRQVDYRQPLVGTPLPTERIECRMRDARRASNLGLEYGALICFIVRAQWSTGSMKPR
jgi:hypothetical protein